MALAATKYEKTIIKQETKQDISEEIESALLTQIKSDIDNAENYLDDIVRPIIQENWDYYNLKKPMPVDNISFVDNTCQASVDHLLASVMDAFCDGDTIEVLPEGNSNPIVLKVINSVINDVLDNENNRHKIYNSFFQSAFVARNGIMKPYCSVEDKIEHVYFNNIQEQELFVMLAEYENSNKYDFVDYEITEQETQNIEQQIDPAILNMLGGLETDIISEQSITTVSGKFTLKYTEKTIKIANIPTENFLINRDAESIEDSNLCGHKSMTTLSELLKMGFDEDKVYEVSRKGDNGDSDDNTASIARRVNFVGSEEDSENNDYSLREVELYELYVKTSVIETMNKENNIAISKLYQVYMANNVILDYQEVDEIPYVGATALPIAHSFWGNSIVDVTKHIQRAKTGTIRQIFQYNQLQTTPRFQYKKGVDTRSLLNPRAGTGVLVENIGDIAPLQIGTLATTTGDILGILESQRDAGVGITYTGQGLMADVLKAGGSTVSASMVLSEQQMMQKKMIKSILENGIKPLIKKIYNTLRDNFDKWEITVDDTTFEVNPSAEWPRLRDVVIRTPLGQNAKLEKAGTYMAFAQSLVTAQGEASKLMDVNKYRDLVIKSYELQGLSDIKAYIATPEQIQQKDEMVMQMQQMQQQMQMLAQQLQEVTLQNQTLQATANDVVKKELELRDREQTRKETETEAKLENMADKQALAESEAQIESQYKADQMALKEAMFEVEAKDPNTNVFRSI